MEKKHAFRRIVLLFLVYYLITWLGKAFIVPYWSNRPPFANWQRELFTSLPLAVCMTLFLEWKTIKLLMRNKSYEQPQ
jgi:hypothetical protein